jgi:ABC-2 type transport system ATP-binding protein
VSILEIDALTKQFGALTAVNALALTVEAGEVFGLLGPNGAGKSTTIKMLTTLLPPTSGEARVAGFSITRQPADVRRNIGYVPQMLSTEGTLTGFENLLIIAKLYDLPQRGREARVRDALAFMGLAEAADQQVRTYSGGMVRRLEIAQSMLHSPPLLFLDEPTVGLDPAARRAVWEHMGRLRAEHGTTIFLTTHLMEEADALCHRVAIMHLGRVVAIGSPAALKESIGGNGATLDDVFIHYTGDKLEVIGGGGYRDAKRARRTARRLG